MVPHQIFHIGGHSTSTHTLIHMLNVVEREREKALEADSDEEENELWDLGLTQDQSGKEKGGNGR